jgi:N-acetylglucosamine-6-phosphate deacetylase
MVGAGFLIEDLNTEIICDKIHLCPDMLRLVFARRSIDHIQMITDSLRCSHMADNYAFEMGGLKVLLKNGEARLVEGGNLAGSTLWMNYGLKNLREVTGLPLEQLIKVTSWNQARELGLGKKLGKIEKGFIADLALLNPRTFDVQAVFVNGQQRI